MSNLPIISRYKQQIFDSIPKLSPEARIAYFSIDPNTRRYLKYKNSQRKVGFLLQRAYFQSKGQFFNLENVPKRDLNYAIKICQLSKDFVFDHKKYSDNQVAEDRQHILTTLGWKAYNDEFTSEIQEYAERLMRRQLSSEEMLYELLNYCWAKKISIPRYKTLARVITQVFLTHEKKMLSCWEEVCKPSVSIYLLEQTLRSSAFPLRELKKINQADTWSAMSRNAELLSHVKDIFFQTESCLVSLNLSPETVKHYSVQVTRRDIAQLQRQKDKNKLSLQLACFVQDQFFQRQDAMLIAFKKIVRNAINKAKNNDYKHRIEQQYQLIDSNQTVVRSAKYSHALLREILAITKDSKKPYQQRNTQVMHLVESFFEAESGDIEGACERVEESLQFMGKKTHYYNLLFEQHLSLIRRLSEPLRVLEFDDEHSDQDLLDAISWFKSHGDHFNESTPVSFLGKIDFDALQRNSSIPKISCWKILLFCKVIDGIKNKKLTLKYSYQYRTDDSYWIPETEWKNNKDKLLRTANMLSFSDGHSLLKDIGLRLSDQFKKVNLLIEKNEIEGFIRTKEQWRIRDLEANFSSEKFIPQLLNNKSSVILYELLSEIDGFSEFSDELKNTVNEKSFPKEKRQQLYAAIMSLGSNIGHHNMARASKTISEKQLRDMELSWLSPESLALANTKLVKFIHSFPMPSIFHNDEGTIHTSSDGKKVVVAVNSLLANFSYKYYGKEQGVSANAFIDDRQAFFHTNVLTSSDREAPYMLDGIVKNGVYKNEIRKHMHSTDTHGFTEAIFTAMHLFNVSFAPRIKNIQRQTLYCYDLKSRNELKGNLIAPKSIINRKKILRQWDQILRILTSIKLGYCSASHAFNILSASEQSSDVYEGMKEFGRLLKSSFILSYLEQPPLRRHIQKQLNRVELGQSLSTAIFFGRQGKLMVGAPNEIETALACNTLLKNVIIAWNYMFLSDYCCQIKDPDARQEIIDSIATGSVIAWAHINMHGIYDFDSKIVRSFRSTIAQMRALKIKSQE